MKTIFSFIFLCLFLGQVPTVFAQKIISTSGTTTFLSDAPLETISATNNEVKGIHNIGTKAFAYNVPIKSFDGFNSALQKQHFNSRYLHSDRFPNATFTGKLIEEIDWNSQAPQTIRAKGSFTLNGIAHQRVILILVLLEDDKMIVSSAFDVFLKDHEILIPKIVESNISKRVQVNMRAEYSRPK